MNKTFKMNLATPAKTTEALLLRQFWWSVCARCQQTPMSVMFMSASGSACRCLPEGLVDRSEPAHVRAGGEHEEPDDGQPKVCYATATKHPHEAANQINRKGGRIN